jgi:hypothetical protein
MKAGINKKKRKILTDAGQSVWNIPIESGKVGV